MSLAHCLTTLLMMTAPVDEKRPDALAEALAGDVLAPADMAQPVPARVWRHAILVRVGADGGLAIQRAGSDDVRRPETLDDAADLLTEWVNAPLEGGVRDARGLARRHVLIAPHPATRWHDVAMLMFTLGKDDLRVVNQWFVGRGARGPGVLSVALPLDVGIGGAASEDEPVEWVVGISDDEDNLREAGDARVDRAADLYPAMYELWRAYEGSRVVLRCEVDRGQPMQGVVALLNEARRFGMGLTLRGVSSSSDRRLAEATAWLGLEMPAADAEIPERVDGAAVSGDPLENPTGPIGS